MFRKLLLGLLSTVAFCFATAAIRAEVMVPPPGLQLGDEFRYVFVTSGTRDASSSNIDDYNAFVTTAASAINFAFTPTGPGGQPITWTAIVSTPTVDARDNTETNQFNSNHADVPIYNLRGEKVAANNADLWDGTILNPINMTELESTYIGNVWTGSAINGTEYLNPGSGAAGSFGGQTVFGDSNSTFNPWINNGSVASGNQYRIYAISSVVPEPSTLIMWSVLVGIGLAAFRRRRKLAA